MTVGGTEMNRMMKTVSQCVDARGMTGRENVCVTHRDGVLSVRATNGKFMAEMRTEVPGGDGESFCVDGEMLAKSVAVCRNDVKINADEKVCRITGVGTTRLPVVHADVPVMEEIDGGSRVKVDGGAFADCWRQVAHAVATDETRVMLTGVLLESNGTRLRITALDGFQMAVCEVPCDGDGFRTVAPGAFMKLACGGVAEGETLTFVVGGHAMMAETDGMRLRCGVMVGAYPDCSKLIPANPSTRMTVNAAELLDALKAGAVAGGKSSLVKLHVGAESVTVKYNSEQADFVAEVPCRADGAELDVAFNQKYLMNMVGGCSENVEIAYNGPVGPAVARVKDGAWTRMALPVRVMG